MDSLIIISVSVSLLFGGLFIWMERQSKKDVKHKGSH